MADFDDHPLSLTFRIAINKLECAISAASGVRDVVISNNEEATSAVLHLLRINGLNEIGDVSKFRAELVAKCKLDGQDYVVTIKSEFGTYPRDAKASKLATESFQNAIVQLQKVLSENS